MELRREGESVGELLAAFELVLNEGETKASFPKGELGEYGQIVVPKDIAPQTELHTIEVCSTGISCSRKAIAIKVPV